MPFTTSGAPAFTFCPSVTLVISELTTISVIGVFSAVSWLVNRSTVENLPFGMR